MVALAVLLSLAELVNWWSVLVLPAVVAGLVKINDLVASVFGRSKAFRRANQARGVARVPKSVPAARGTAKAPRADAPEAAVPPRQLRRRHTGPQRFSTMASLRAVEPPER